MTGLRQKSHEGAAISCVFSEADSKVGKQRLQDLLGGLLAMEPDDSSLTWSEVSTASSRASSWPALRSNVIE